MDIGEAGAIDKLRKFVKGLDKEQADVVMRYLPQLIALLEEPTRPYLQEPFLQTG